MPRLRIRERLTFANVVSLLALFIALGGTSYAVTQINGAQIKNRSISANKIALNSLTAKQVREAATSDSTKQLVVSAPRTKAKTRQAGGGAPATGSTLVKMNIGDSVTLLQAGPLAYHAGCVALADGSPGVTISVTSSEAGALLMNGGVTADGTRLPDPEPVDASGTVYIIPPLSQYQGQFLKIINGVDMIAPSGATLHVGNLMYGTNLLGSPCYVTAYAVG